MTPSQTSGIDPDWTWNELEAYCEAREAELLGERERALDALVALMEPMGRVSGSGKTFAKLQDALMAAHAVLGDLRPEEKR